MSALAGRVVVVTRAEHQAAALEALLQAEGATVYRYPCLAIAPPTIPARWMKRSGQRWQASSIG